MRSFIVNCVQSALLKRDGQSAELVSQIEGSGAHQLADLLIQADLRGHYSHGVNRLDAYLGEIMSGVGSPSITTGPVILKRKGATAWVDGTNGLGVVVGNYCTQLAVEMAKEFGIGWVVAKNSNHFGICAHYTLQMADLGLIGMAFTNTSPVVFPTGSAQKSLGTNPLSVVANGKTDQFALDMATSTVAFGKIEVANRNGQPTIPNHWAADSQGRATMQTEKVLNDGGLLPLGSVGKANEEGLETKDSSHKGTGLSMMVELFCGILGQASYGKSVRKWRNFQDGSVANLGQCFVAVDTECFAPGFAERLQDFIKETHNLPPVDATIPVLVPGDPETMHSKLCNAAGGILYTIETVENLKKIGLEYNTEMFGWKKLL
uniref:Malate dehydrogenase n=1 Tax=Ditylenchus dipsaci TaxID=166011 RepID=A0A915EAI8_9BILA